MLKHISKTISNPKQYKVRRIIPIAKMIMLNGQQGKKKDTFLSIGMTIFGKQPRSII